MFKKLMYVVILLVILAFVSSFFIRTNSENLKEEPIIMEEQRENIKVSMVTNMGVIELELFADKAPKTVENFTKLARDGFYNGTLLHRVISDFMVQGGDPNTKLDPKNWQIHGTGGPGYSFDDEINDVLLEKGILAMANAGPNTNGSQFFIVTAPATPWLDGKHTAFGKVVSGMDVVDEIEKVEVNEAAHPIKDIIIEKVEVK